MRRRGSASIVANPVLVGAVTTLVVIVAVFLSYNANNGLPFVPTRQLNVVLPNGSELVKGNEVRIGGFRSGVVTKMTPVMRHGRVEALVQLKLDKNVGAIPVDSEVVVRQRSALGLKYLELDRGRARRTLPDGAELPSKQAVIPVDLDQVYNTFNRRTRVASATNLVGFGDTFAGRGTALNEFIQSAPGLLGVLQPVMSNLADRRTHLAEFFQAIDRTVRVVAPISQTFARGFSQQADTFAAIDASPPALKATISKSPPTLDASTRSFRIQTQLLRDLIPFAHDLSAAAAELPPTLPVLNRALEVGTRVSPRTVSLNHQFQLTLERLDRLVTDPHTLPALRGLTATVNTLQPTVRFLGPFVTVCNDWNMFWTFNGDHFSTQTSTGTAERAMLNSQRSQTDSVGSEGAILPAAGRGYNPPPPGVDSAPQYLHANAYTHAVLPNGRADCENNQGYRNGGNPFSTLQDQNHFKHVVLDTSRIHYDNGRNYRIFDKNAVGHGLGPARVPPGETWTASPGGLSPRVDLP
jgi:virulence factor Mce-like protein